MREDAATKARRYLTEGRLLIRLVHGDRISAECRGDGEVYVLGLDPNGEWWCSCPARTTRCAHLLALRSVTVRTRARAADTPAI